MATEFKLSYTAAEIDEKLGKIDSLANKNELPTKTSDLINDSDFVTRDEIHEQVQPNWNQNNSEATDYIANRPFYTEDPVKTVVFEEETVVIGSDLYSECSKTMYIEVGKTYYVIFNGVEYECVAWTSSSYYNIPCIGNGTIVGVEDQGNGEPFCIEGVFAGSDYTGSSSGTCLDVSESGEYTISISTMIENVRQLDTKFIPSDDTKMNVKDSISSGSFSMNRMPNTDIGAYSTTLCAFCEASGTYSYAEGYQTIATGDYTHAQGSCNIEDTEKKYLHIVGNGKMERGKKTCSNAHTLDWNGVGWYQGGLQVGGNAQDDGAKNVLLEGDAIPTPTTATVGQTIIVKSVDENGKPIEWETVDCWVISSSTEGSTKKFKLTIDDDGVLTATEIVESII